MHAFHTENTHHIHDTHFIHTISVYMHSKCKPHMYATYFIYTQHNAFHTENIYHIHAAQCTPHSKNIVYTPHILYIHVHVSDTHGIRQITHKTHHKYISYTNVHFHICAQDIAYMHSTQKIHVHRYHPFDIKHYISYTHRTCMHSHIHRISEPSHRARSGSRHPNLLSLQTLHGGPGYGGSASRTQWPSRQEPGSDRCPYAPYTPLTPTTPTRPHSHVVKVWILGEGPGLDVAEPRVLDGAGERREESSGSRGIWA